MYTNIHTEINNNEPVKTDIMDNDDAIKFKILQENFAAQYESAFPNKLSPKTVIIIPSLTLDEEILNKIDGIINYEERMLCLLMLLRMPRTHVVYVSSMPIDDAIIDYYLHLLPGITGYHARQRLTLLSCYDSSAKSLTEKILERPRLITRIKNSIPAGNLAHISFFNVTAAERSLSLKLQVPLFGCDPDLLYLSSKSMGRQIFKDAGIPVPYGYENLVTPEDIKQALIALKVENPNISKAIIKINEGFSGEGNAIFSYKGSPSIDNMEEWFKTEFLSQISVVAKDLSTPLFLQKFSEMGGIVEAFVEGAQKESPSVQCRINPLGKIEILSTHDQILGGENKQIFLGATFPANPEYAAEVGLLGEKISDELKKYGVLGRFAIDFMSVKENETWKHYAIEINLRKGGTTHPYLMLQFLTDGEYDDKNGSYLTAGKQPRYYVCTDNLQKDEYRGLTPHDLIDIAMCNDLLYDGSSQVGVIFHLIGTLSQYGKLGVVCIGDTPEHAQNLYDKTKQVLDKEGGEKSLQKASE